MAWRMGCDASAVYPIPDDAGNGGVAQVGPKIVGHIHGMLAALAADARTACLEAIDASHFTVMFEFNDPEHEHIFPIPTVSADHVALLGRRGLPVPQREAFAFFDRYGLHRVPCDVYEDAGRLEEVMETVRASTETEGVVIYLERTDDAPVGLVKVKSDHYVIARRTRETLRSTLVTPVAKGTPVDEALKTARKQLRQAMKLLTHLSGCRERHEEWADFAIAFAQHWADAYRAGDVAKRKELVAEYAGRYGSLYHRFWTAWRSGETSPPAPAHSAKAADAGEEEAEDGECQSGCKGRNRRRKKRG
mmetsp:Transcript_81203/g.241954  ORF Transcript_81203/g.241954 Transcript_81203/m.241954 type:complete len:305 (+) Transcript_81203:835-1749(+)